MSQPAGQGLAFLVFAGKAQPPQQGPALPGAHLAGMWHCRKSRVATLLQLSTPCPRSHFSTVISVAGDGWTRSRSCSRDRNRPAGTRRAQGTLPGGRADGGPRARGRYRIAASAGPTRRGRGGRGAPCPAAGAPASAARRARGSRGRRGPSRGAGCGRAVSAGHRAPGTGPRAPAGPHLPARLVPLRGHPRGAAAPGGRAQAQHGGERPAPAAGPSVPGGRGAPPRRGAPGPPPPPPAPRPRYRRAIPPLRPVTCAARGA